MVCSEVCNFGVLCPLPNTSKLNSIAVCNFDQLQPPQYKPTLENSAMCGSDHMVTIAELFKFEEFGSMQFLTLFSLLQNSSKVTKFCSFEFQPNVLPRRVWKFWLCLLYSNFAYPLSLLRSFTLTSSAECNFELVMPCVVSNPFGGEFRDKCSWQVLQDVILAVLDRDIFWLWLRKHYSSNVILWSRPLTQPFRFLRFLTL